MQKADYPGALAPTAQGAPSDHATSRKMLWTGRVLSALPVLTMLFSASLKLSHAPQFLALWTGKFGYAETQIVPIALLEIVCAVVYAIPRTAVFGAILITGYLGGAVATHVRVGDHFVIPVVLGVLAWLGVYLRDDRLRALVPLR
jgi:hypothetical protein